MTEAEAEVLRLVGDGWIVAQPPGTIELANGQMNREIVYIAEPVGEVVEPFALGVLVGKGWMKQSNSPQGHEAFYFPTEAGREALRRHEERAARKSMTDHQ